MNIILNALMLFTSISGTFSPAKIQNKEPETSYTSSVPETEHEYVRVTIDEPTLTQPGKTMVVCPICGQVLEEGDIPPLGPKWGTFSIIVGALSIAAAVGVAGVIRKRKLEKQDT